MQVFCDHEIDGTVFVVEHPAPRERDNVLWNGPREDEERAIYRPSFDFLVEKKREEDADNNVEEDIHHGPDDGLHEHGIEAWFGRFTKYLDILSEADKVPVLEMPQVHIRKRQHHVVNKRIDHHANQYKKRRRNKAEYENSSMKFIHSEAT